MKDPVRLIAEALHFGDFIVPCGWRKRPLDECPMHEMHQQNAEVIANYLRDQPNQPH